MNYGATYSTDPGSFGEITAVFEVEEGWDGFRFHGYCVPTDQEVEKIFFLAASPKGHKPELLSVPESVTGRLNTTRRRKHENSNHLAVIRCRVV